MAYSIIGTRKVGKTLAAVFANARGRAAVEPIAKEIGSTVAATSLDEALQADIVFVAVPFPNSKTPGL